VTAERTEHKAKVEFDPASTTSSKRPPRSRVPTSASTRRRWRCFVDGDWVQARKYLSLSEKYEQWKDFKMPARGIGLHALVVAENDVHARARN
jgi:hypothetical protein